MPRIFITGVTGFIGGDVLHAVNERHEDWDISALVRDGTKSVQLAAAYPHIRLVRASLADVDIIRRESASADVVLHFANSSDDEVSVGAILEGIAASSGPGYLIHTSGTGILFYPDVDSEVYGESTEKVWDDVEDIKDINTIPAHALHRHVDQIVLSAADKYKKTKTAIVCPPNVYGTGRGPCKTNSDHLPLLIRVFLQRGAGFMVGSGRNRWSNVHVQDLSKIYLSLAEAAVAGGQGLSWRREGYYFAAAGEHVWGTLAASVAETAHKLGYLKTPAVPSLAASEVARSFVYGAMMWGTNSLSKASRAREYLRWKPNMPPIEDEALLTEVVQQEAEALLLSPHQLM